MTTQELVERSFFNADDLSLLIMEHPNSPEYLAVKIANEHDAAMARRLSEMEGENKRLLRFVQHIAKQPLADQCRQDHEDEGHDGEPDFEGAYDAIIEQARAALEHQQKGEGT